MEIALFSVEIALFSVEIAFFSMEITFFQWKSYSHQALVAGNDESVVFCCPERNSRQGSVYVQGAKQMRTTILDTKSPRLHELAGAQATTVVQRQSDDAGQVPGRQFASYAEITHA